MMKPEQVELMLNAWTIELILIKLRQLLKIK